jgi:hypothetical protein
VDDTTTAAVAIETPLAVVAFAMLLLLLLLKFGVVVDPTKGALGRVEGVPMFMMQKNTRIILFWAKSFN